RSRPWIRNCSPPSSACTSSRRIEWGARLASSGEEWPRPSSRPGLGDSGPRPMSELTHFDESGASRMVDVSGKDVTQRTARASGRIGLAPATLELVKGCGLAKGDVLEVARLAGIMAAKRVGDLIPLCHPLGLDSVEMTLTPVDPDTIRIEARVKVHGR